MKLKNYDYVHVLCCYVYKLARVLWCKRTEFYFKFLFMAKSMKIMSKTPVKLKLNINFLNHFPVSVDMFSKR